jgi:hypothetical protein
MVLWRKRLFLPTSAHHFLGRWSQRQLVGLFDVGEGHGSLVVQDWVEWLRSAG